MPAWISDGSEPEILAPDDSRFGRVVDFVDRMTRDQGLSARFRIQGGEVIISG
ncbi:hypothetical protein [Rhizorhapis suberifaciens]|uniref:Uncharacterized protein n=1 Tax=Rhizorhapis suberifaciens TaxID=13656 RepID=A0A840HRQ1_9SPHN|nr:hypothetical protein [Rhizorhapis suberifaciens]MBB4640573.1 hypothetical protein [Rhizorhapis suberifaciens]